MSKNDMIMTVTPEQQQTLTTAVRKDLTGEQCLHLDQLEVRIRDHRERFTLGLLEIGRCLNEAKDAQLVPHGCWQDWVAMNTGFTVRGAQRIMKAAREIPKTSALTLLDFTKVSALLALPADEREDFARDVGADRMTSRELDAAVKEKLAAEKRAEKEKERADAAERGRLTAMNAASRLNVQVLDLQEKLKARPTEIVVERAPEDYEQLKRRDAQAAARIREAERYADDQEALVRDLRAQLDEARSGQTAQPDDAQAFIAASATFFGEVCRWQNMTDVELLRGRSEADLATMRNWVHLIAGWASTMEVRLAARETMTEVGGYVR